MWLPTLVALGLAASATNAQVYYSQIVTSCLNPATAAPPNARLEFNGVYAQLDQGQLEEGALSNGFDWSARPAVSGGDGARLFGANGKVLRVVLVGKVGAVSAGYSNTTNTLQTVVVSSEVATFAVGSSNSSALCSSIRNPSASAAVVAGSGCPYGTSGDIALGLSIPLTSSYPLTTISTSVVLLDASAPALTLACYVVSFTPYYSSYFAYRIIHYLPIALASTFLLLYLIARGYAARSDVVRQIETELATSLTVKLSGQNTRRYGWGKRAFYSAFAGSQIVRSGSLRRFVTPELCSDVSSVLMSLTLVGTVAVEWPAFACEFPDLLGLAYLTFSVLTT